MLYIILGVVLLVGSLGTATLVQTNRLENCQNNTETLKAAVNVAKEEARLHKQKVETDHKLKIGETDAKYKDDIHNLNVTIEQLRKQRNSAGSSVVPRASNSKSSTVPANQICFDREEFSRAQSDSENEIEELINESAKTALDYKCGVEWVKSFSEGPKVEVELKDEDEPSVVDKVINYIKQ